MAIIINNEVVIVRYTATASQTVFTYAFPIFKEEDLTVSVNDVEQTLTTNYTVTGAGDNAGGTVVFGSALSVGDLVVIFSDIDIERTIQYQENGDLLAETLNTDFNRQTRLLQQISDIGVKASGSIQFAAGTEGLPLATLTADVTTRAGKVISFDSTGQPETTFSLSDNTQNKTDAAASETAAALSETNAATSETNAATSETNASSAAATGAATGVATALTTDQTWLGDQTLTSITETSVSKATSFTPDLDDGSIFVLTATGTITMPTAETGKTFTVIVPVGTHVTWAGSPKWHRGTEPTKSSGIDMYSFVCDGTNWLGGQAGYNFS